MKVFMLCKGSDVETCGMPHGSGKDLTIRRVIKLKSGEDGEVRRVFVHISVSHRKLRRGRSEFIAELLALADANKFLCVGQGGKGSR